jgi:hypothetical protein
VKRFESRLKIASRYPYWNHNEETKGARIVRTWNVFKTYLHSPGLSFVIDTGSRHIKQMIEALRQMHETGK